MMIHLKIHPTKYRSFVWFDMMASQFWAIDQSIVLNG